MVQVAELEFWDGIQGQGGNVIPMTCTNPGGSNPNNEGIDNISDRNSDKWLDFNFGSNGQSVVECTLSFVPANGIGMYKFQTANDASERDPWAWTMEYMYMGEYVIVSTVTGGRNVPDGRNSWAEPGYQAAYPGMLTYGAQTRWTITGTRSASTMVQVSELEFWDGIQGQGGKVIPMSCSNPGGSNPGNEGPAQIDDRNGNTKWLDFNFGNGQSVVVCTMSYIPVNGIGKYKFLTGNDAPERDPWNWTMEYELDGVFQIVDTISGGTNVPSGRTSWSEPGYEVSY